MSQTQNDVLTPYRVLKTGSTEEKVERSETPLAVALGVFDGVHIGHQKLLQIARDEGARWQALPAALTFDPNPAVLFVPPPLVPLLLGTLEERAHLLREAGAEAVWVAQFDRAFAALTPDAFVEEVLLDRLNARVVVVGEDFRFGKNRAGEVAFLREAGQKHGFQVCVVPPVLVDGIPARSTRIRERLASGQVEEAARLLGRRYTLRGTVAHGRKMGRTLGYPTANLDFPSTVIAPGDGVYAGYVQQSQTGSVFRAAISVGTNPTVTPDEAAPRTVEAFLMDGFNGDLYGQSIGIEFAALLRPMLKFDGLEPLVAQMQRDVEATNHLLKPRAI